MSNKKSLGRGLSDLGLQEILGETVIHKDESERITNVPIVDITKSPYQSRTHFDLEKLNGLAQTIRKQGIIQPLMIRRKDHGGYELIAGERRMRAAKIAGLFEVPCIIKENSAQSAAMMNLLENLHREDLNIVEEAESIRKLIHTHNLTHNEIADTMGQSRSSISNKLRILHLHPEVLVMLTNNQIDMGHAKCILTQPIHAQLSIAKMVHQKKMSVRQLERFLQGEVPQQKTINPLIINAEARLTNILSTKTSIKQNPKGGGQIVINFKSSESLKNLMDVLTGVAVTE